MKTLLTVFITGTLVLPATATAGYCPGKGYHKHHGYHHGGYYPHAYHRGHHPHGGQVMQKHHWMKKHHGKMHRHKPAYANPSNTPYSTGANMYYLHLPQDNTAENLAQTTPSEVEQLAPNEPANIELTDLITTAAEAGQFNTLIEAINAAGLEQTLAGPGPFTVFAPTDEAFSRLPETILKALTEDPRALSDLLTAHVVPGRVTAAEVVQLDSAKSLQGSQLDIAKGDEVMINGAKVISTDIEASNGIIHVIDSVIFPQS